MNAGERLLLLRHCCWLRAAPLLCGVGWQAAPTSPPWRAPLSCSPLLSSSGSGGGKLGEAKGGLGLWERARAAAVLRVSTCEAVRPPSQPRLAVVMPAPRLLPARALGFGYLTQDMIDDYEPALMFTIPRLAIVW